LGGHGRHLHLNIDAIQQRTGQPRLIIRGAFGRAAASLCGIAEMSAAA